MTALSLRGPELGESMNDRGPARLDLRTSPSLRLNQASDRDSFARVDRFDPEPSDEERAELLPPRAMPQSSRGRLGTVKLDTAVELNRRSTPPGKVAKRSASRYSIAEANTLSYEQIKERLEQIRPDQDKPLWIKALDIIDLPRNVVAGAVSDVFLPGAKRAAIERGEFDQFGNVKITAADMLREMGFENKFINAVAGFGLDVLMDPITWVGGPIGGLKSLGTRGAVEISTSGSRALRSGIKVASAGGRVADDATRNLIDRTLEWGRASRQLADDADPQQVREFLTNTIYGQRSTISKTAGKAGLGEMTRGGTLAEDLYKVTDDVAGELDEVVRVAGDARIGATKDFIAKHTNNPGLNMSGGRGGIEVAHIPFTTKTITLPTPALTGNVVDRLPVSGILPGQRAVTQMALSKAVSGKPAQGAAVMRAFNELDEVSKISEDITRMFDESTDAMRRGEGWDRASFDDRVEQLGEWAQRYSERAALDPAELESIEDIGDLLATGQAHALAQAKLRESIAMIKNRDETGALTRFTGADLDHARRMRRNMLNEASSKLGADIEGGFDDLIGQSRQDDTIADLFTRYKAASNDRLGLLIDLADEDLARAQSYVDSLHGVVEATAQVAKLQGGVIGRAAGSEHRMLAHAARTVMGIDDANIGMMPLASTSKAFENMAPDVSSWISDRGKHLATSLGGLGGTQEELRTAVRRMVGGAPDRAAEIASKLRTGGGPFSKGIDEIVLGTGIKTGAQYDRLMQLITARVEDLLRSGAGASKIAVRTTGADGELSSAARFYERAVADGFLSDDVLRADIDTLASETADYLRTLGDEMLRRGEVDDLIDGYIPVRLAGDAQQRARTVNRVRVGDDAGRSIADQVRSAMDDPSKARMTNIVEFEDADGISRSFLLLEDDVWRKISPQRLEALERTDPDAASRIRETLEHIERFEEVYGTDELVKRDLSRPMLPFELNEYAQSHALDGLIGGSLIDGHTLFETNMANLLYARTQSHHIAQAEAALAEIVDPFILTGDITAQQHKLLSRGSKVAMDNGVELEVLGDGRYKLGTAIYRHMSESVFDPNSMFNPMMVLGGEFGNALVPEQLAVAMERMNQVLKPETMPVLMQAADKTTAMFKISTLAHPSWTVGNIVGNTMLMAMAVPEIIGVKAGQFARSMKDAMRIVVHQNLGKYDPESLIKINGVDRPMGELLEQARQVGATGTGGLNGDINRQWLGRQHQRTAPVSTGDGILASVTDRIGSARNAELARLARMKGDQGLSRVDRVRAGLAGTKTGVLDKVVTTWFGANGMVDDVFRTAHLLMMLDDGMDIASAGRATRQAMLNFGDMTSFERNWVRPLVPFYAWTRASLPNMMMRTLRQPQHIAAVPKLVTAIEEAMVGDDRIPRWQRPSWLNETLAVQLGSDDSFLLGTLLPQEGVAQVVGGALGAAGVLGFNGQDMFDALNWGAGQSAPALKVPTELAMQRESFSGRSIGAGPGDGDITLNDYLLGQVRWLRETGLGMDRQGSLARAYEQQGLGGAVARGFVGGRFSPALAEDSRETAFYFELQDEEKKLRKAFREEDDPEKQDGLRVELLGLYANHIRRGGNPSEVPKWAIDDLGVLGI